MSGAIVAGAVIAGGISYASQRSTNRANQRAANQQGYVDTTTTRREDPRATGYLATGADAARNALLGGNHGVAGDPNLAPAGNRAKPPAGMRYNAAGKLVPVRNPAPGTAPAGAKPAAPPAFNGQSPQTAGLIDRLSNLGDQNEGLYGAGEDYVRSSLAGDATNPLMGRAATAAEAIAEDPRLAAYQDFLMANLGVGSGKSGGARGGAAAPYTDGSIRYTTGAGGALNAVPTGGGGSYASATGADAAIKKLLAGELPPGWADAEAGISRSVAENRAAAIRDLRARASGSGFYGGDLYQEMEEGAIAQGDRELADALASERYGAMREALGLGTQYDLGMADIAARDRATNASAGAAGADIASREKLAQMGFLQDALQLGEQGRFGRAGALGDLAGIVSGDQRSSLAGVSDIGGARRGDLGAAGSLSLGSDEARNSFLAARGSESVGRANVSLGRAQLGFDRERFYDPLNRTATYTDIINSIYGGLGSETTSGRDTRSSSPPAFASPYGAGLTGAAIGGQIGAMYNDRRRAGYQPPAGNVGGD